MKKLIFLFLSISFFYFNCGPAVYYVKPPDWENGSKRDSTIKYYSQFIKGWKFFIDPGHGGNDRFNKGPEGDAIEADLNLRVSLNLRNFLKQAGAEVILSRDKDTTVELIDRSKLSNESGSDIFISVHHNALGNKDHYTNYTSTWYHAYDGHKDYNPSNHDIAKYVQRDLAYVMGNSGSLGSFDGTMSDYTVYPNSGFSVLRNAKIPAILIEGSFFSSYYEEQRLIIPEFNEIQAWGIFRGLGKYLRAGIPRLELLSSLDMESPVPIRLKVWDPSGVDPKSINILFDGKEARFGFNPDSNIIIIETSNYLSNGNHLLKITLKNKNGNHNFPYSKNVKINPKPFSIRTDVSPREIPPDENAIAILSAKVLDKNGKPVADSSVVEFIIDNGKIEKKALTINGVAKVYITAPNTEGKGNIEIMSGDIKVLDSITYIKSTKKYLTGSVIDTDSKPVPGCGLIFPHQANIVLPLPNYVVTDENGKFILPAITADSLKLAALKDGYYGKEISLNNLPSVSTTTITLEKSASGVLFGKNIVIDPRYGGMEKGEVYNNLTSSRVNLEIANYLVSLLKSAGAEVMLVRQKDEYVSEASRAELTKDMKKGSYIRIDVSNKEVIGITQYPNISNTNLSKSILKELNEITKLDTQAISRSYEGIFMFTGIGTISVSLPSLNSKFFNSENLKYREMQCAWGIYNGILNYYGFDKSKSKTVKSTLISSGQPLTGVEALLDGSVISVTDNQGQIIFYSITGGDGKIIPLTETE